MDAPELVLEVAVKVERVIYERAQNAVALYWQIDRILVPAGAARAGTGQISD